MGCEGEREMNRLPIRSRMWPENNTCSLYGQSLSESRKLLRRHATKFVSMRLFTRYVSSFRRARDLEQLAALRQDSPVISANTRSTSVNRVRVLVTVAASILPMVTRACAVRDDERCTTTSTNLVSCAEPGWTGFDCSDDIDECSVKRPCREARVCLNQPGSYKCDCLENFIGQNCETVRTMVT